MGAFFTLFKRRNIVKPLDDGKYKSSVGDYNILQTLGTGGSCKVKLAFTKETDNPIALKIMNQDQPQAIKQMK